MLTNPQLVTRAITIRIQDHALIAPKKFNLSRLSIAFLQSALGPWRALFSLSTGYLCFHDGIQSIPTKFLISGAFRHFLPFFSVQGIPRQLVGLSHQTLEYDICLPCQPYKQAGFSSIDGRVLQLHSVDLVTKDLSDYGKQTRIFFEVECFSPFSRDLLDHSLSVLLP